MSDKDARKAEVLAKVADYNVRIKALIAERTAYMDENMTLFSKFAIGDEIYDTNGRLLGHVTELYRYWADGRHDGIYDKSMSVDYRYHDIGTRQCYIGTSGSHGYMTRNQVARHYERMAADFARKSS